MVKKFFLLSSVLFGFLFFIATGVCFADASTQLEQAENYYEAGDYPKAEQIYNDVLKQYAGTEFAFQAQKNLTILYIAWGNKPQAEASFEKLANMAASADIAAAIRDMASYYSGLQKSEEPDKRFQYYQALSICRRQLDVVDQPGSEYAMWSQVRLAMSNIEFGDAAAQAAIDKLLTEFSENPQIARGVHEVALKYRVLKKYEKAIELYQYVVAHRPDAEYTVWSQMDLAKSYVALGDDPNAEAAVDKLLANFSNNPDIAQTVYDMASCYRGVKKHSKAINLYQHIIDSWPEQKYAMWSLRDLAMSNVDRGDDPNAQAAVDNLIANYSEHVHIPSNVYEIAKYYRKYAKYKKAINLYQDIVNRWPTADHAIWSQLDMAASYSTIGNEDAAQAAVDELITKFNKNPHIAGVVYEMAKSYRRSKKHEKADQLYLYIVGHWPKTEHAMLAQRDLATSNADLGQMNSARAAIDKLLTEFSDNERIAQTVYEIANYYCQLQQYEDGIKLYQYVVENWPDDLAAIQSQTGIALANIGLANDPNTEAAVDKLIADFNDHPALPAAILRIEEEYYKKILAAETWVRENYLRPIGIWEKVLSKIPYFFYDDPDLYYFIACCYYQLGQYENAIYYYSIVIDNWPDYKYVRGAQRLMETCFKRLISQGK